MDAGSFGFLSLLGPHPFNFRKLFGLPFSIDCYYFWIILDYTISTTFTIKIERLVIALY